MTDSIHVTDGGEVSWIPEELNERMADLERLVRGYGEMANYFCEKFACCDAEFANCKYCIGLPQGGQCELGRCNDKSKELGIEQPDYSGELPDGVGEWVSADVAYEQIEKLERLVRDMWKAVDCDHCPMYSDDCWLKAGGEYRPCMMIKRIAELGIEVDE